MANRIQLRRDGAQQWANVNPILAQGELGIELDTSRLKMGDGVTPWNSLKYERPLETESNTADTLVKRDADGNFEAGAITASLIGNAATATRLANARSFTLTGDMSGTASFDGSANINITAELNYQPGLPHYDAEDLTATGTYTQLTIDSRGRVVTGGNPTTLAGYGITDAQQVNTTLTNIAALSTTGIIVRSGAATVITRNITGQPGQLVVSNGDAVSANPLIGLADTPVVVGSYNPTGSVSLDQPETSVAESGSIHQTVNTTEFTVDRYGRLTYAQTAPISTAREGTLAPLYDNATAYSRYDKVKNADDRLYEAILPINAGGGAPTHTDTSDAGSWRYLGSALTPQKGLASFSQEDFDVTAWDSANSIQGGYVKIAERGVDNLQLQNNRIGFADGNTVENFELDQELTATTGYRGFNYLNYVKVNDTSGSLLFGANNTGDGGAGEIDVNVRSYFSDPDITLDGAVTQTLDKTGNGNLIFQTTQNDATPRYLRLRATNAGAGSSNITIEAEDLVQIDASDANGKVKVEGVRFQDNYIGTGNLTLNLDPGDDRAATGTVRIWGDLQVDGTTTTINSVTTTIQDPIVTLGGEDTLTLDDNKDRGIEFRYYDSQERFGFFGWDEDYANSNIWSGTGGYRFLYNATNTNEVYAGTDAPLIAGNLRLTTNTGSTSTTTGTLVVTGGVGISENVYIGGTVDIANDFDINSGEFTVTAANGNIYTQGDLQVDSNVTLGNASSDTLLVNSDTTFEDDVRIVGPNTVFSITNGTAEKFVIDTDNGNIHSDGTLDVDNGVTFNSTLDVDGATTLNNTLDVDLDATFHDDITLDTTGKFFKITNGAVDKFVVTSSNGNTDIRGTLDVGNAVHLESTLQVDGNITLGNSPGDTLTINSDTTFTDDITVNATVDFDSTLNVDGAVDFNSTLVVDGQTTIYDSLILQSNNEDLLIKNGASVTQFSVDFDNGNTVIGISGAGTGTLTVHGDATFNDNTVFTDNVTIGDANTDTLTVNSVSTFTDNVTVNGNLDVDGNAVIEGNLTVNGSTTTINSTTQTLDDPVFTLGGDTAPVQADAKDRGIEFRYYSGSAKLGFFGWDNSAGRFAVYHNATNNSEAFNGTRSGIDAGNIKLFDTTNSTAISNGTLVVGGGAGIGYDLRVGQDLFLTRNADIDGSVDIASTLDVGDDFAVSNKFTVDAQTGNTFVAGTFAVNGNSTIGNASSDAHTVTGTVQFNQALTGAARANIRSLKIGTDAANEIGTLAGNLILDSEGGTVNITDNADVDGNLNVDGNTQIDGTLTVDGNTTIGNAAGDAHSVTGTVTFNQPITSTDITADAIKIGVDGVSEISTSEGPLILDSAAGYVSITDSATISNDLTVSGNTTIGNSSVDTLTVTATSTFSNSITSQQITARNLKLAVDGTTEVSTVAGNLVLDSFTGETQITDNLTVTGTVDVSGETIITDTLRVRADNEFFIIETASGADKFTVDTDSGNTLIEGTFRANGASIIDDTFNVTGAVDLDSTLNVDGVTTITDATNASTGSSFSASGALQVTGGASVAQDVAIGGNTQLYGNLTVDGTVLAKDNQEFRGRVEFNKNENPSNLNANAPIMITNGGLTVAEDAYIGTGLFIGANNASTFTVAGASGNTSITGTLNVTGVSTLSAVTLNTLSTNSTIASAGNFTVGTNKFSVSSATGNTSTTGSLTVGNNTILSGTLNVVNAVDLDSTLNIDGATSMQGALTQNSTSRFNDDIVLQGASKSILLNNGSGTKKIELHSTSGNAEITGTATVGTLDVTNNSTIGGTLGVTGQITGNVTGDLTGTADEADLIEITDTTTDNATYYPTFVAATSGYTEARTDSANLTYNPSQNRLTVANFRSTTDFEVQGNFNVTGALTFQTSQVGSIANHDTDALSEGTTNLYFTDTRVDSRVNVLLVPGNGLSKTFNQAGLTLNIVESDIDTDNVTEGSTNLFTTAVRTRTHFTYGNGIELSGTGELSVTEADINSDNITEGVTNLFTTAARTRTHFTYGTGIELSVGGDLSVTQADINTDNITEGGTNRFFTQARTRNAFTYGTGIEHDGSGTLSVTQADINTDNITEGTTNLFITDARVRGAVSVTGDLNYSAATGVFSFTERTDAEVNGLADARIALNVGTNLDLSNQDTDDLSEGTTNLYYTDARADARVVAGITGKLDASAVSTFGGTLIDDVDAAAARTTLGLGTVATTDATAYATAAQGALADSAIQSADLATVATTGAYSDLTGTPTLGTAAATASTDYATAAQGALADSALQSETIDLTTLKSVVAASTDFADFQTRIAAL